MDFLLKWLHVVLMAFVALFPIVNPFGAVPFFISITGEMEKHRKHQQIVKSCLYVFFILTTFLIAGNAIMNFFGISIPAIRIAGGLILFRIGNNMLKAKPKYEQSKAEMLESQSKEDISFTPLAMPMLSGPGSIAVTLGLTSKIGSWVDYSAIMLSILIIAIITFFILRASTHIARVMGVNGMNVMTRMMGFITVCISVQFVANGVLNLLKTVSLE